MRLSFGGAIATYTYNCPLATKFRLVDKVRYPKPEETEEPEEALMVSKKEMGIQDHETVADYLKGAIEELPYESEPVEFYKELTEDPEWEILVEPEFYLNMDYERITASEAWKEKNHIYFRPDLVAFNAAHGVLRIPDWKFGDENYGQVRHYHETSFFASMLAYSYTDADRFETEVYFPKKAYSLPPKTYGRPEIGLKQLEADTIFEKILTGHFQPNPSRLRCKLCDFRSEDAGGIGNCEYSSI